MSAISSRSSDGIATLTLNRPALHNAFDDELIVELTEALRDVEEDRDIRAVVLTGTGKSFSAGADLGWMRRMAKAGEKENRRDARQLAKLMRTLNRLEKPTVARVNGPAYGGGVGLIACCDIAIGVDSARFALSEVRLGLAPAVISPYVVDAIGIRQARRLFLTGEIFDAAHAERIGLLHHCVPAEALDARVDEVLGHLRAAGPEAVLASKHLLARIAIPEPKERRALDEENADLIARLRVSVEGQEGLAAFFDKRRPSWHREPSP